MVPEHVRSVTKLSTCQDRPPVSSSCFLLFRPPVFRPYGTSNSYVTWDLSAYNGKLMYETAMQALLNNKLLMIRIVSGSYSGYDKIQGVRIYQ
jgi:hypothetical protein